MHGLCSNIYRSNRKGIFGEQKPFSTPLSLFKTRGESLKLSHLAAQILFKEAQIMKKKSNNIFSSALRLYLSLLLLSFKGILEKF